MTPQWGGAGQANRGPAMFALHRAVLAALLALPAMGGAGAATSGETGHRISDPNTHCALLGVILRPGDTVNWIGECRNGRGEGPGTASFFNNGREYECFTGTFAGGVAQDGHVIVRWGNGWSYEGGMAAGRFNGHGVFTRADGGRLEGHGSERATGAAGVAGQTPGRVSRRDSSGQAIAKQTTERDGR
jgi:hypothetical protein